MSGKYTFVMDAVERDLYLRLERLVSRAGELFGFDPYDQDKHIQAAEELACKYVAGLRDPDPEVVRQATTAIGDLVDLADPTDALSPLGLAIASHENHEGKLLRQSDVAKLLGVSRQRVWDLIKAQRLDAVGKDRRVTRTSVAAELARRTEKKLHVVERLKRDGAGSGEYMTDLGEWAPLPRARHFPTLADARRVATAGPGKSFARGITVHPNGDLP